MAEPKGKKESASAKGSAPASAGYLTLDGNEALKYVQVGGKLVSVTKQFPNNPFKPGKRYVFIETKDELDALVARSQEGL